MAGNQPIDVDAALGGEHQKRTQEMARGRRAVDLPRGVSYIEIKSKQKMKFDIIPFIKKDGTIASFQRIKVHRYIGVDPKDFLCLSMIGKPCPICNFYAKVKNDPTIDKRQLRNYKGVERYLYNVVDGDDPEAPIQILDMPPSRFDEQLHQAIDDSDDPTGNALYASLTKGRTIQVTFRPTDLSDKDLEASRIDFFKRRSAYAQDILQEAVSLDSILSFASAEELVAVLSGADAGSAMNAEVEATAEPKRRRAAAAPAEDAPLPEEPAAPARRRAAPPADEPAPAPAEEAAPAPRRRAPAPADDLPPDDLAPAPRRRAPAPVEDALEAAHVDPAPKARRAPAEEAAPAPAPAPAAAAGGYKCPNGLRFGIDGLSQEICDTCKVGNGDIAAWQGCLSASRKAKRAAAQ